MSAQSPLTPLETLYDAAPGEEMAVPPELASLYGPFKLSGRGDRPRVIGNFVTTLDGVVALNTPGYMSGAAISGNSAHDRLVMGLLRAVADAVVVGAGTLRSVPNHLWTAPYIYPALADQYQALRATLGKPPTPLNVIVTARGEINPGLPVFQTQDVPVLIVTTADGMPRIRERGFADWVQVVQASASGGKDSVLGAGAILEAIQQAGSPVYAERQPPKTILMEGGPHLMGEFFAEGRLDELFLTLAPQVAGRDSLTERPGLVAGKRFAPEHPIWGTLTSIKRGDSHVFLRYTFDRTVETAERGLQ